ncbi:uncharacterized protein F4822DRAFT_445139 [Hypoxylon trugodes]|uniref:uncharacterized protein n=1 Tax=Hypoxylon trugodes TaxID=326681 RepID=UPI0021975EDF|nr:uncharacterized protein F4822DRAFT_445139 [Hypoxylon trugodes]KAI1387061.1 hypothetical protein F4822DRAFT_445139 [Hypoxylon trugodes]
MDTNDQHQYDERAIVPSPLQTLDSSSIKCSNSTSTSTPQATTKQMGNSFLEEASLDLGQKNIDKPTDTQHRISPVFAPSTEERRNPERLKARECPRPSIDAVLCEAFQITPVGDEQENQHHADAAITSSREGHHTRNDELSNEIEKTIDGYGRRVPYYGIYLDVPGLYEEDDDDYSPPKCPRCRWTLQNNDNSPPGIPIISVTSPDGKTRYPHDHTYYLSDSDSNGDSDYDDDGESDSDCWD